jgi:hypothetical protein
VGWSYRAAASMMEVQLFIHDAFPQGLADIEHAERHPRLAKEMPAMTSTAPALFRYRPPILQTASAAES